MMERLKARILGRLGRLDGDQSGAVALVCLAALLVIFMMGMVYYDSVVATSEKIHVQTATDASTFSETAVRARTMNMIAMTNVGKRMTIGNVTAYINIKQWITAIKQYTWAIAAICVAVTGGGCAAIAGQLIAGVSQVEWMETRDSNKIFRKRKRRKIKILGIPLPKKLPRWLEWAAPDYSGIGDAIDGIMSLGGNMPFRIPGWLRKAMDAAVSLPNDIWKRWDAQALIYHFYGPELRAFDNYQRYMENVTPYWSWTEGVIKGLTNRAPVTVSYPHPFSEPHQRALPIERANWSEQCDRAHDRDKWYIFADVVLKQLGTVISGGGGEGGFSKGSLLSDAARYGSILLAALGMAAIGKEVVAPVDLFAPRTFHETCLDITSKLLRKASSADKAGQPRLLKRYPTEADWLMDTSTITFGMRPNGDKMKNDGGARQRYGFLSMDYNSLQPRAGATWTLSRGEIVHKTDNPNMWAPEWSARIRPVALSGEFEEYSASNFNMRKAFNESLRYITYVSTVAHGLDAAGIEMITHPYNPTSFEGARQVAEEILAAEMAVDSMENESMGGISK